MHCPKCLSETYVKNGVKYSKQRYKRGASLETKLFALKLYLEGMGFRSIGRVMNVSNVTVLNWIRTMGKSVKAHVLAHMPDDIRDVDVVEVDEMWHLYSEKKRKLWVWIAIDRYTQEVLGFSIGSRGKKA